MAVAAIVGAAIVVGGAVYSADQQRKAARAQERANQRAARVEQLQGQRQRQEALRQQRIRAAQIQAQAANAEVSSSSAVQGALGSLESQGAANMAFANQIDTLSQQRLSFLRTADTYETRAGYGRTAQTIGSAVAGGG